jgi:hypothetical protein
VRLPLRETSSRLRASRPRAVRGSSLTLPALRLEYAAAKLNDDSPSTVAPSASARIAFDVGRAQLADVDRKSIRDTRAILDPTRNPLSAGAFEHISFGVIGYDESTAIAKIKVVLRGTALPVALDQRADDFGRLARSLRALESEPHEIHPEQTRRRQRLARQHSFVADRDPVLVEPMLETPQPEGARSDHGGSLADLRNFEILAMHGRTFGMNTMRRLRERLAFIGRAIGVLGKDGRASPRMRREHDDGIAGGKRRRGHQERNCM